MGKLKKKKFHQVIGPSAAEMVKRAEASFAAHRYDDAIRDLRQVESKGKASQLPVKSAGSSADSLQGLLNIASELLGRALAEKAFNSSDLTEKVRGFEEALQRRPEDVRILLALGLCRLAAGETEPALRCIERARELAPSDFFAARAFLLGLLQAGQTRHFKDELESLGERRFDPETERLAALRRVMVGNQPAASPPQHPSAAASIGSPGLAAKPAHTPSEGSPAYCIAPLFKSLGPLAAERFQEAIAELTTLPSFGRNPTRAESAVLATQFFRRGVLRLQSNHRREALSDFAEAQRFALGDRFRPGWLSDLPLYLHAIAQEAIGRGDLASASECWKRILESDPADKVAKANLSATRGTLAAQAWREGRRQEAFDLWNEGLKFDPGCEELLKNLAIASEQLGRDAEAIDYWKRLAHRWRPRANSRSADAHFKEQLNRLEQHLAEEMIHAGRPPAEIKADLGAAIKADPHNCALRLIYADIFIELGKPDQALKHLEFVESRQGVSASLLMKRGMALEMMERMEASRKCFERAYELEPANPAAKRCLVSSLGDSAAKAEHEDDCDGAIRICERQLAIDPSYLPALGHLAALYFETDQPAEARQTVARLIEADPIAGRARVNAARIYQQWGYKREAEALIREALEVDQSESCLIAAALHYLTHGNRKKALELLNRAAKTASVETFLFIADALLETRHDKDALRFIDMAIKKDPGHPVPVYVKALGSLKARDWDGAYAALFEAERLAKSRGGYAELIEDIERDRRMIVEMRSLSMLDGMGMGPSDTFRGLPPELVRLFSKGKRR